MRLPQLLCACCISLSALSLTRPSFAEDSWPPFAFATALPKLDIAEFERHVTELDSSPTKLWGRDIAFDGVVTHAEGGSGVLVKMEGLKTPISGHLGQFRIINADSDHQIKVGDRLHLRGLILQQDYSVWSLWTYEMRRLEPKAPEARPTDEAKETADPFVGDYTAVGALADSGARRFTISNEGEFYRLRDQADDRRYESVRFVRKSDSELIDEGSNLGTITAGDVAFGDGRRAKSAILRVNFCYEMYLLIDTRAEGMFP